MSEPQMATIEPSTERLDTQEPTEKKTELEDGEKVKKSMEETGDESVDTEEPAKKKAKVDESKTISDNEETEKTGKDDDETKTENTMEETKEEPWDGKGCSGCRKEIDDKEYAFCGFEKCDDDGERIGGCWKCEAGKKNIILCCNFSEKHCGGICKGCRSGQCYKCKEKPYKCGECQKDDGDTGEYYVAKDDTCENCDKNGDEKENLKSCVTCEGRMDGKKLQDETCCNCDIYYCRRCANKPSVKWRNCEECMERACCFEYTFVCKNCAEKGGEEEEEENDNDEDDDEEEYEEGDDEDDEEEDDDDEKGSGDDDEYHEDSDDDE